MLFGLIGRKKEEKRGLEERIEEQEEPEKEEKTVEITGLEQMPDAELFERYHKNFRGPKTNEANRFDIRKIEYELANRIVSRFPEGTLVICQEYDESTSGTRSRRPYPGRVMFHTDSCDMSSLFDGDSRFKKRIGSSTFEYIKRPFKTGEDYSTVGDSGIFERIRSATKEEVIALLKDMSIEYKPDLRSTELSEAMKAREYAFFKRNIEKVRMWNQEKSYFDTSIEFSGTHYIVGMTAERDDEESDWHGMQLRPVMTEQESCESKVNGLLRNLLNDAGFCKELDPPRGKDGHFYMSVFSVPREAHKIVEANNPIIPYAGYRRMN